MVPFRLTCLGHPELHGPEGDPVKFRTRKHFALLIYLTVEPPVLHRRDRIATLLWPEATLDEARHSLATGLSLLRGRLGADAFETTRDAIRLIPGRVVTDIPGLDQDDPDDVEAPPLGPFLEEFEIADAPDFHLWKEGYNATLLPRLQQVLALRIEHARKRGDSRRVESLAHVLRRVDPLNEDAARAMLEARALAGDRIGALQGFDRWRERLQDELGAQPSTLLERMADRLRRNKWERPSMGVTAPVPTAHWKERVFVGRGMEFRTCYEVWEKIRNGEPGHVLVRGESGIGKTTLVERFVASVALEGASVGRVQCYELERELPFGVIGGLVTLLLDLPGAGGTPPAQLAELGRLVTKVHQRYPSLPAPLPSVGESARIMFTEGVMALLAALADEQPVVLVVDDIHLADATSLAVLHLILRRAEHLPLMVLLTSSSVLTAETPGARKFVENADSIGLRQLALGPLVESEAAQLLEAMVPQGTDPGPTIRRSVLAGARGNPMVLELLMADWTRRGDDCVALALGAMNARSTLPRKEAFRRLVEETLSTLDPETRSIAQLGAILGQRLNDLSMYTLVDMPVARTMRAMTSLASHRVLRDAGHQLEFANEFVRTQCYDTIPASLRRMLHGLVADRLLAQDGAEAPIPGLEIAWHLVRAGRLEEAVPYLLAGARESIRLGAPHETDLALSTGLPALTGQARRTAILLLAEAKQELGQWGESLRVLEAGGAQFTESEATCREILQIIARDRLGYMNDAARKEATNRLCQIAQAPLEVDVRVRALAAVPLLLNTTRDGESLTEFRRALRTMDVEILDDHDRLYFLLAKAWQESHDGNWAGALELIDMAVTSLESSGTKSTLAIRILVGAGQVRSLIGAYEAAVPFLEQAVEMAKRIDNMSQLAMAAANLALAEGRLGRTSRQLEFATLALGSLPDHESSPTAISAIYEKAVALALEQRALEAVAVIEAAEPRFTGAGAKWEYQAWNLMKADVSALVGNSRKALTLGRRATTGRYAELTEIDFGGIYSRWQTLLALKYGDEERALERLSVHASHLESFHAKDQVEILTAIAMLKTRIGQDASETWSDVERRLGVLPAAVGDMLRRFGTTRTAS